MTFHLTRYQPWSLHREFLNEFNRLLDRSGNDESTSATAEWAPAVDIDEHADKYVLHADVPGVDPNAIEITLEHNVLTLSGSREKAVEQHFEKGGGVESRSIERLTGRSPAIRSIRTSPSATSRSSWLRATAPTARKPTARSGAATRT
jgi:hypothetical protein